MSYEGYTEYLCPKGHHHSVACSYGNIPEPIHCHCGARWSYYWSVNETNGIDENDPQTMPAPTEIIRMEEHEHVDFKGNTYYTQTPLLRPAANSPWLHYPTEEEEAKYEAELAAIRKIHEEATKPHENQFTIWRKTNDYWLTPEDLLFATDNENEWNAKWDELEGDIVAIHPKNYKWLSP